MEYTLPAGGCVCPQLPPCAYGIRTDGNEGETMTQLELIRKEKNAFGDMVYVIRDERGCVSFVYEGNLEHYLQQKGVTHLVEGAPFVYATKNKL
jgi:hypothetical protein